MVFLTKVLFFVHLEFRNYIFSRGLLNPEFGSSKTHFVLKKIMLLNLFFSVIFFLVFFCYLLHFQSVCLGCQHWGWVFSLLLYSNWNSIHWITLRTWTVVTCHWEGDELSSMFWISLSPNINPAVEGYQTCIWLLQLIKSFCSPFSIFGGWVSSFSFSCLLICCWIIFALWVHETFKHIVF